MVPKTNGTFRVKYTPRAKLQRKTRRRKQGREGGRLRFAPYLLQILCAKLRAGCSWETFFKFFFFFSMVKYFTPQTRQTSQMSVQTVNILQEKYPQHYCSNRAALRDICTVPASTLIEQFFCSLFAFQVAGFFSPLQLGKQFRSPYSVVLVWWRKIIIIVFLSLPFPFLRCALQAKENCPKENARKFP